jgi:ethanolamine ammonia-lyase large subunit
MVTLEARAYGVARHIQRQTDVWTIVNDVAGFIGPEVFRTEAQLERACLEDAVMAKLHGVTMGLDVCATFHMGIPPVSLRELTERIARRAAPAYLMAVAGNADPMLGYLTTSFRDHPRLRMRLGRHTTSAMERRFGVQGQGDRRTTSELYAAYIKAGGDRRGVAALAEEGERRLSELGERGFDLGHGCAPDHAPPPAVDRRLDAIYANAREALYASVDESAIRDVCARPARVRTEALDRDDYLAHPTAGERLLAEDAQAVSRLYPLRRPQVQIVVSDGLNANAVSEHLRALLPLVRRLLRDSGFETGTSDVVIRNGRVRAGYHVGALIDVDAVVHLLGERPGTGLNTLSAYLTYGRDDTGAARWHPALDHSCTTAVCGIHPRGKRPDVAAAEIARTVVRMFEQRRSGVGLR